MPQPKHENIERAIAKASEKTPKRTHRVEPEVQPGRYQTRGGRFIARVLTRKKVKGTTYLIGAIDGVYWSWNVSGHSSTGSADFDLVLIEATDSIQHVASLNNAE